MLKEEKQRSWRKAQKGSDSLFARQCLRAMTLGKRSAKVPLAQRLRLPMARGSFVAGAAQPLRQPTQFLQVQVLV